MSVVHTELSYCTGCCTVGNPGSRQVQYAGAPRRRDLRIYIKTEHERASYEDDTKFTEAAAAGALTW
jgi:hypothetical protein